MLNYPNRHRNLQRINSRSFLFAAFLASITMGGLATLLRHGLSPLESAGALPARASQARLAARTGACPESTAARRSATRASAKTSSGRPGDGLRRLRASAGAPAPAE